MKTHTLVAVVALAGLAAGSLPSQSKQSEKAKPTGAARLQAANDALRAKVARLEAENRRLKATENGREQIDRAQVPAQIAQFQRLVRDVRIARPVQLGVRLGGDAPRLDVMLPKGIRAEQLRVNGAVVQWLGASRLVHQPSTIVAGEFKAAADELSGALDGMRSARDFDDARKALDRAERAVMQARRALWDQQNAKEREAADPERSPPSKAQQPPDPGKRER